MVQVPVPEQTPDQLENVAFASEVAVRVTTVFSAMLAEQVAPQEIPDGDATDPVPVPDLVTVRVWVVTVCTGMRVKVAVTFTLADIATLHVPVPEHAPDQPVNE